MSRRVSPNNPLQSSFKAVRPSTRQKSSTVIPPSSSPRPEATPVRVPTPNSPLFTTSSRKKIDPLASPKAGRLEGGIRITREDVESVFTFFDVEGRGVLRPKDLKARVGALYPNMTNKEYRFLINEPTFTVDSLWNLLENPNFMNEDPVKEAFKVFDPHNTGYLDSEVLKGIMSRMGFGEMSTQYMTSLIKTADNDMDGKVSLRDFKAMLKNNKVSSSAGRIALGELLKDSADGKNSAFPGQPATATDTGCGTALSESDEDE
jgi:calmodulin